SSPRAEAAPVTVPDVPQPAAALETTPAASSEATPEAESSAPTLDEYLEAVAQWGRISQPEDAQVDAGPWLGEPTAAEPVVDNAETNPEVSTVEPAQSSPQVSAQAAAEEAPWLDDLVAQEAAEAPAAEAEPETEPETEPAVEPIVTTEVPASGQSETAAAVMTTRTDILAALPEEVSPAQNEPAAPARLSEAEEPAQVSPLVSSSLAERIAAMTDTPV